MTNVGIYKIMSPSGRVYIGQSWDLKRRFERYRGLETKKQPKLHNSFLKYGVKQHEFNVIHELPNDITQTILDTYEDVYLCQYRDCGVDLLNTKEAGSHGKHSDETKLKISLKNKGNGLGKKLPPRSEEWRRNISLGQRGKKIKPETIEKNRLAQTGKKATDETKKKMSESRRGKKMSEDTIQRIIATKKERGITMSKSKEAIEKGIPTRFKKGEIPKNAWVKGHPSWNKGVSSSLETREKIRQARAKQVMVKGRKPSEETRLKMSESAKKRGPSFLGKRHSQEVKEKQRLRMIGKQSPMKGKKFSESVRNNMSVAAKKVWASKKLNNGK